MNFGLQSRMECGQAAHRQLVEADRHCPEALEPAEESFAYAEAAEVRQRVAISRIAASPSAIIGCSMLPRLTAVNNRRVGTRFP